MKYEIPRQVAARGTWERITTETLAACLTNPPLCPTAIKFSTDSRLLYVHDRKRLHTWTIPDFNVLECCPLVESEQGSGHFLSQSADVMLIGSDLNSEEGIHHIAIRDLSNLTLKAVADVRLRTYGLFTVILNTAEDELLLRDYGQTGYFFDFPSMKQIRSISLKGTQDVIYSPNESEIWTTGGHDGNWLSALDGKTGELLRRRPPDKWRYLSGLRLTPDKRLLLVVGEDILSVLDARSWDLLRTIVIPPPTLGQPGMCQPVLAFSSDSRLLAMAHDSLCGFVIIDCHSWEIVHEFAFDHEHWYVRASAFSPDGRFLACASYENHSEVKLLDVSGYLDTNK